MATKPELKIFPNIEHFLPNLILIQPICLIYSKNRPFKRLTKKRANRNPYP
jgi:hypothetical protein